MSFDFFFSKHFGPIGGCNTVTQLQQRGQLADLIAKAEEAKKQSKGEEQN